MAIYKHGTYGEFADSVGKVAVQSGTTAVYVGCAPVNLIRGYAERVNIPVKLSDMNEVRRLIGYSANWEKFDLCEAFKVHFDNPGGNVGSIVAINVLNPATHKKDADTEATLTFVNGVAYIQSDTIILDTLKLTGEVESTDYSVSYDFTKGRVVISSIGEAITGSVEATYTEVDVTKVTADDIIGDATDAGTYSGLSSVSLVYQELGIIPNLILCPKWSGNKAVYNAMITAGTKINGHWDAFVLADIPVLDGVTKVDSINTAIQWKETNGYTNERAKVFWPMAKDNNDNIYHAAVLAAWLMMLVDASHTGIPMESPSNKIVPVSKQYFGATSTNRGFDQQQANILNAAGITTVCYWGGRWVLWGNHTAAYKHEAVTDNRVIFDNSIRMMMYVSNSFQLDHALTIDQPMTRAMKDTILNLEQAKMDALAAIGAFIGTPVVNFVQSNNSVADMVEGDFVWSFEGTPTPPFKSATLKVAYSTAGFDSYFEEV